MYESCQSSNQPANGSPGNPRSSGLPEARASIQQLEAELQVERFINQLNNHIYGTLASHSQSTWTQNPSREQAEAEIFQIVVGELRTLLGAGLVAIALPADSLDSPLVTPATPTLFKICHLAPTPQHRDTSTQFWGQVLRLGSLITTSEVQTLGERFPAEVPVWQMAHPILNHQGTLGWLLVVQPRVASATDLPREVKANLVQRVAEQCAIAIQRARLLQVDCPHCQKLEAQNRQLLRTNQLKSDFLANTSHEIRTPLSSILGFTHLLLEQGYSPTNLRHQEYLNIILSSGQHLLALINDILDLSKVEANQLELQWEMIDVPDLCRKVLLLVKEKAHSKGLKLTLDLDPNATTFVADSLRLKQMLFNLLSNAIKFTLQGAVGLQVKQAGIFLHFTVWDTGIGIAKDAQQQLFRPYSQIANEAVEATEGTGLGLALTQKLADLHSGWVDVVSEVGQGSQFTLVLPLTPKASTSVLPAVDSPTPRATSPKSTRDLKKSKQSKPRQWSRQCSGLKGVPTVDAAAPSPGCRVLLVEDNSTNATLLTAYLNKVGCEVIWARESQEMWQNLEVGVPDLILMDVNLPQVDGLTLIRQIRKDSPYPSIPVIVQTAMAMAGDREICLEAGATDYISKPINFDTLHQLVAQHARCLRGRPGTPSQARRNSR